MPRPTLYIDFHGTLCQDIFWRSAEKPVQEKIRSFLFGPDRTLLDEWMLGKHSSESVNRMLAEHSSTDFETLWKVFEEDCKTMHVSPASLKKITQLRKHFKTILLTDNMDCFERFTIPAISLDRAFDQIIDSSKTGRFKKEAIPLLLADPATAKDSFLIDDSRATCDLFEKHGGKAFLATAHESLEYHLDELITSRLQSPAH